MFCGETYPKQNRNELYLWCDYLEMRYQFRFKKIWFVIVLGSSDS